MMWVGWSDDYCHACGNDGEVKETDADTKGQAMQFQVQVTATQNSQNIEKHKRYTTQAHNVR